MDCLQIRVKAGDGGSGCVGFLREKFRPRGGPAGGDGGRGGHVILEADAKLGTLYDLKHHSNLKAKRGGNGGGNNCHGADGADLVVKVPIGTIASDADTGEQLADLTEPGQRWIAARGGRGGFGNAHFATPTNKTPRYAQDGGKGEERTLILDLKLIADVGLIGLPNAGKSTLLSKLTAATPKIAPYPFTTLNPNLGVMEFEDQSRLTLADIPGLIEGASKGAGLGDRFLRHIERTRILAHLIGDENGQFDPEDMLYKYDLVRRELAAYGEALTRKREILVFSKTDLAEPEQVKRAVSAFRKRRLAPVVISAAHEQGLDALKERFRRAVRKEKEKEEKAADAENRKSRVDEEG